MSKALPGFRDFYPPTFAERAHIFRAWREVERTYGFAEYDGPPLEPLDLYTKKSGDEIVGQLYNFTDKGGREVSLRPEMTPTFARMVAARANALRKPGRWFSVPQLFRYERQQKGRLREHFQLNVDIVGEADVTAVAELLACAIDIMRAFGLTFTHLRARVSDRRLLSALLAHVGVADDQLGAAYAAIDKVDREPRESLAKKMSDGGISAQAIDGVFELASPTTLAALRERFAGEASLDEHFDRLERYFGYLAALGVAEWVQLDLSIVRGLAYYTGIVFELFDNQGEFRAICGGGRYDNLLQSIGGADLPALGFGMGDVVLGELRKARGLMPDVSAETTGADYWLVPNEGVEPSTVLRVAAALRSHGASVEYVLNAEKLQTQKSRAQIQNADKAGAKRVLVLNANGIADVKFLRVPEQPAAQLSIDRLLHEDAATSATALAEIDPDAVRRAQLVPTA